MRDDGTWDHAARVYTRGLRARADAVEALGKEALEALARGERDRDTMLVMYAPWCPFCTALQPDYEQVARDIGGPSLRVAKYNADEDREFCKTLGLVTFPTIVFMPKGSDKARRCSRARLCEGSPRALSAHAQAAHQGKDGQGAVPSSARSARVAAVLLACWCLFHTALWLQSYVYVHSVDPGMCPCRWSSSRQTGARWSR